MIRLKLMGGKYYQSYLQRSIPEYASAHLKAGNWKASEALQRAKDEFTKLLPNGVETEGQHLLQIEDEQSNLSVGVVWFAEVDNDEQRVAFLYDLYIDKPHRRHGYGMQAIRAMETQVRELGIRNIFLHVFADNRIAISLYRKLGYEVVKAFYDRDGEMEKSLRMSKAL